MSLVISAIVFPFLLYMSRLIGSNTLFTVIVPSVFLCFVFMKFFNGLCLTAFCAMLLNRHFIAHDIISIFSTIDEYDFLAYGIVCQMGCNMSQKIILPVPDEMHDALQRVSKDTDKVIAAIERRAIAEHLAKEYDIQIEHN